MFYDGTNHEITKLTKIMHCTCDCDCTGVIGGVRYIDGPLYRSNIGGGGGSGPLRAAALTPVFKQLYNIRMAWGQCPPSFVGLEPPLSDPLAMRPCRLSMTSMYIVHAIQPCVIITTPTITQLHVEHAEARNFALSLLHCHSSTTAAESQRQYERHKRYSCNNGV